MQKFPAKVKSCNSKRCGGPVKFLGGRAGLAARDARIGLEYHLMPNNLEPTFVGCSVAVHVQACIPTTSFSDVPRDHTQTVR